MGKTKLSRRDFLKGAGITGAAAAGAVVFPAMNTAFAEGTSSGDVANNVNPYSKALGNDATMLPMRKSEFSGPHGPIAFEDREITDSEIGKRLLEFSCSLFGVEHVNCFVAQHSFEGSRA